MRTVESIDIQSIYEQNLNFLIGSGASFGFLPTLYLSIKDEEGSCFTFETLAQRLESDGCNLVYKLLFVDYYLSCLKDALPGTGLTAKPSNSQQCVLNEYKKFVKTVFNIIDKSGRNSGLCNIYTTNYDTCFELAFDYLIRSDKLNFHANDGALGFNSRNFHSKNFDTRVVRKSIFSGNDFQIPQVNILHVHGSVSWQKENDTSISVNYLSSNYELDISEAVNTFREQLKSILDSEDSEYMDVVQMNDSLQDVECELDDFMAEYKKMPIVNPTKWKFHKTVFEEAYYQLLRHLSLELERPNSVLITYGFSFADEHIRNLIFRALSNPSLTLYVCCFNHAEKDRFETIFNGYKNVILVRMKSEDMIFRRFNESVFSLGGK